MAQDAWAHAVAYTEVDFVAARYAPSELVMAGPGRRLAGALVDTALLMVVTIFSLLSLISAAFSPNNAPVLLFISVFFAFGWFAWFVVVAPNGQTPGKQMLGMYVMKADGTRAGGGYMWLRELLIKDFLNGLLSLLTGGIYFVVAAAWCLFDKNHQCLWDKLASTYVAYSPLGFKPLTASGIAINGQQPPRPVSPGTMVRAGARQGNSGTHTEYQGDHLVPRATSVESVTSKIGVFEGGRAAPELRVTFGERLLVGRDSAAQVRLSDPKASRRHLELRLEGDGWVIRDLGATNPASIMSPEGIRSLARNSSARMHSGQLAIGESVITLYPAGS